MWEVKLGVVICMHIDIYVYSIVYMIYLISSLYLRVFDDDRVRGTREQMLMMQLWPMYCPCSISIYLG